ncbi:MAG: DoxX family protein [Povalibacter sp.]
MTTPALQTTLPHMHVGSSRLGAILRVQGIVASMLERLQPLFALAIRFYVSWVFLKSGWLKLSSWDQTLSLFHDEYHVPLLPPDLAAVVGTFGELFFPMLLIVGLAGRIGAVGLFAVNAMAVISYAHVLFAEGFEAAIGQHILWGFMLLVLAIYGPGSISADRLIAGAVHTGAAHAGASPNRPATARF